MLSDLGEPFEVVPADVDETPPNAPLPEVVRAIARRKAEAVARRFVRGTVVAADTVVDRDGVLLGKPVDAADARAMLRSLSGRSHLVHTGVAVVRAGRGARRDGVSTSLVVFRRLADEEIDAYVASGEPYGKAGAYAIQGGAQNFIERVDGDVDNVVGLPMSLVRRLLADVVAALAHES